MGKQSLRRCLSCKQSSPKEELFRFVLGSNGPELDSQQNKGGRGSYLHRRSACIQRVLDMEFWKRGWRSSSKQGGSQQNSAQAKLSSPAAVSNLQRLELEIKSLGLCIE